MKVKYLAWDLAHSQQLNKYLLIICLTWKSHKQLVCNFSPLIDKEGNRPRNHMADPGFAETD